MSTPDQLEKVKLGYTLLDTYDRGQLRKFIEEFDKKSADQQINESKLFFEKVQNKSLGPTSSVKCLCCGK